MESEHTLDSRRGCTLLLAAFGVGLGVGLAAGHGMGWRAGFFDFYSGTYVVTELPGGHRIVSKSQEAPDAK